MEIKAADVMKLRKMTGAGMMDCKKALIEAEGDFARAQDIIREKGKLIVAKRADRTATEGVVVTKIVGQKAYILCLACETDFVAQNSEYSASAEAICCVEKLAGLTPEPIDYGNIPGCTYTSPEVASVGLSEAKAAEAGYELKIGKFPFTASIKALEIQ